MPAKILAPIQTIMIGRIARLERTVLMLDKVNFERGSVPDFYAICRIGVTKKRKMIPLSALRVAVT